MQDVLGVSRDGESFIPSEAHQNLFVQKGVHIIYFHLFELLAIYRPTECGPALEGGERGHLGSKSQMAWPGSRVESYHGKTTGEEMWSQLS